VFRWQQGRTQLSAVAGGVVREEGRPEGRPSAWI